MKRTTERQAALYKEFLAQIAAEGAETPPKRAKRPVPVRYSTFTETAERIIREEAPRARVVTDCLWMTDPERSSFVAWVDFGDGLEKACFLPAESGIRLAEIQLRAACQRARDQIGARALGP